MRIVGDFMMMVAMDGDNSRGSGNNMAMVNNRLYSRHYVV